MTDQRYESGSAEVTPEDIVHDYLIGKYELEKLQNGFQAPVVAGEPCENHRHLAKSPQSQ